MVFAGSADCKCIVCLYLVLRSRTVFLYRSAKSLIVIELEDIGWRFATCI